MSSLSVEEVPLPLLPLVMVGWSRGSREMDSRHFAMKRIHIFISGWRYLVVVVSIAFKTGSKWGFETISLAPK